MSLLERLSSPDISFEEWCAGTRSLPVLGFRNPAYPLFCLAYPDHVSHFLGLWVSVWLYRVGELEHKRAVQFESECLLETAKSLWEQKKIPAVVYELSKAVLEERLAWVKDPNFRPLNRIQNHITPLTESLHTLYMTVAKAFNENQDVSVPIFLVTQINNNELDYSRLLSHFPADQAIAIRSRWWLRFVNEYATKDMV
jgi:hypothetical protein